MTPAIPTKTFMAQSPTASLPDHRELRFGELTCAILMGTTFALYV